MVKVNEAGWYCIARIVLGNRDAGAGLGWHRHGGGARSCSGSALSPLLTGLIGWCPLYSLFHFGTKSA